MPRSTTSSIPPRRGPPSGRASRSFDAALAVLTVHHWADVERGLSELRRVAKRQVILGFDVRRQRDLWLVRDYVPACAELEHARAPSVDWTLARLEHPRLEPVP